MSTMKRPRTRGPRPRVTVNCVADTYTGPGERIIEFSSENGGGLIAFRMRHDGTLLVDIYRTDPTVRVVHDTEAHS